MLFKIPSLLYDTLKTVLWAKKFPSCKNWLGRKKAWIISRWKRLLIIKPLLFLSPPIYFGDLGWIENRGTLLSKGNPHILNCLVKVLYAGKKTALKVSTKEVSCISFSSGFYKHGLWKEEQYRHTLFYAKNHTFMAAEFSLDEVAETKKRMSQSRRA